MSGRRGIADPAKYGLESSTYLSELITKVNKKVATLDSLMNRFQLLHARYLILIAHLYENNQFDRCEKHVTNWMMMVLFLHDRSQLIQTGRFQFTYQTVETDDEVCPDKVGDFSWDCGTFQLNMVSVQGHKYQHDIVSKFMKAHDTKYVSKMTKALDNNVSWEQTQRKLTGFDTTLKRMIKELENVGAPAHIVFKVISTHGKEVLEVRTDGQIKKFDRKGYFASNMTKEKGVQLCTAIDTESTIQVPGDEGYTEQFFAQHQETTEADAKEAAAAVAEMKKLAAERTAADKALQAEKRKEREIEKAAELLLEAKASKLRERDKVLKQYERAVSAVVKKKNSVSYSSSSGSSTVPSSRTSVPSHPPVPRPLVTSALATSAHATSALATSAHHTLVTSSTVPSAHAIAHQDDLDDDGADIDFPRTYTGTADNDGEEDERPFIVGDGPVKMRRNHKGFLEEISDNEQEEEREEEGMAPAAGKRQRREPTTNPIMLNSALAEYLYESGRRQLAVEGAAANSASGEGSVSTEVTTEGAAESDTGVVGAPRISRSEMEDVAPGVMQSVIHKMYDKLNYADVISKNSTKSREERNRAIDIAYCEVVVNDVCDTVMKNHYRDQNCAAYWYHKRVANDTGDAEVSEIERHMWKLFFIEVKAISLERVTIKPQVVQRPDIGGKPRTPLLIPVIAGEKAKNELRARAINTAISKLAKKIIFVYEALNERLLELDLASFVGCGFVMPHSHSNMNEVFHSIELDADNVLHLIVSKEFDLAEYAEFKELIMTKKNRADLKTHAQKLEKKREEARLQKEADEVAKLSARPPLTPTPAPTTSTAQHLASSLMLNGLASSLMPNTANAAAADIQLHAPGEFPSSTSAAAAEEEEEEEEEEFQGSLSLDTSKANAPSLGRGVTESPFNCSTLSSIESTDDIHLLTTSSLFNTPTTTSVASQKIPYIPVDYGQVSAVLKKLFLNTQGECGGLFVEHNKLKTQAFTSQHYVNDLAHIVTMITQFKSDHGFEEQDFEDILNSCKRDDIVRRQVFIVRKQFPMSEVEFAYDNNTRADGYCMWWMSLQQKLRADNGPGVDCATLRAYCEHLKVDVDLAPHIQHYLDCVKYKEKESQDLAHAQLTTVLGRAKEFPHLNNPFNLWGNSKLCRFIDVRLMLFCLESASEGVDSNNKLCRVALLSIVNHALGDMYQDGAPQFTYDQLENMFCNPMYAGFMRSHFFSLENPEGATEVIKMQGAYRDWIHCIVERLEGVSETQLAKIRAFDSNNKHHGVIDLAEDSDEEEVLTMLEEEIQSGSSSSSSSVSAGVGRFSGEVSFHRKAPFRDEQRELMFETIRLMQQRIDEMENAMSKMKLDVVTSSENPNSPIGSTGAQKRKLNPKLSSS